MNVQVDWQPLFEQESAKPYFGNLIEQVKAQRAQGETIYPPEADVFTAFKLTALADIKVVILGQDPYHGEGQAHGLAFSVKPDIKIPPSLKNIYKELATDIQGFTEPEHGYLHHWAEQGVLLLNTVLTVKQAQAHSHAKLGWETFTDAVIAYINQHNSGCVFMLWGGHAKKKGKNIDADKHSVLTAPHPSPLSVYRGFYGCKHFSKANEWLNNHNKNPIDWRIGLTADD